MMPPRALAKLQVNEMRNLRFRHRGSGVYYASGRNSREHKQRHVRSDAHDRGSRRWVAMHVTSDQVQTMIYMCLTGTTAMILLKMGLIKMGRNRLRLQSRRFPGRHAEDEPEGWLQIYHEVRREGYHQPRENAAPRRWLDWRRRGRGIDEHHLLRTPSGCSWRARTPMEPCPLKRRSKASKTLRWKATCFSLRYTRHTPLPSLCRRGCRLL